ncbi:helix-turn-helix domain-containing protein [Streptomyces maoxianensis]|uniref:Helix-turn-helix domain-containing protein n=1 Tax=Streptomyces maoxianensis TaxID=1459942 RepID=A0ABV9G2R1_9ACTN|nr:helix-turn-helix domain-containing protein [Streptomyces sp. ISL-1]MBT2389212.1 helix-turn-helix domain-containing protein [Streptomyces sp. ISL-1]
MTDLSQLLQQAMRRHHLTPQAVADKTGIRTPRIRAFAEDGAEGPIRPTEEELAELADALALPLPAVMDAALPTAAATAP